MKTKLAFLFAILMTTALFAAPKDDIRKRSEERYPQVLEMKSAGKIGETSEGLIDAVKGGDDKLLKLIDAENADRKALYKIIAKEQKITEDAVAQQAAARNFSRARKGDWLKEDGTWRQK